MDGCPWHGMPREPIWTRIAALPLRARWGETLVRRLEDGFRFALPILTLEGEVGGTGFDLDTSLTFVGGELK